MKSIIITTSALFGFVFLGLSQNQTTENNLTSNTYEFTLAFGSCNHQNKKNTLWDDVLQQQPDVWVWGGDIIYADTKNMSKMKALYDAQLREENYAKLVRSTSIMGTWDDHDYGANDAGEEYPKKRESKKLLLDFLGVFQDEAVRNRSGIYHSKGFKTKNGTIKIIILDTRYFRTALTTAHNYNKRYEPSEEWYATILGKKQWLWLEKELKNSRADFNIIVSSIQVLSQEHGFETWGNFPKETEKLMALIKTSKAKGVIILSGDRHISEWSKLNIDKVSYPIIDFTSSGLTHSYTNFSGEPNKNRVGNVISEKSFGLLKFDIKTKKVQFEMRGDNSILQQSMTQHY